MSSGRNPYAILGVPTFATQQEISVAYRRLARQYHPDVSRDLDASQRMQEINWAYGVLGDPASRQSFDGLQRRPAVRGPNPTRGPSAAPESEFDGVALMGGTADRAIVGSLVAVALLAISLLIGLETVNLGAPIALAVGCWIGSVPNARLSSQHGMAIGAVVGLFSAASVSASIVGSSSGNGLLTGFLCCAPFSLLIGGSLGAMAGTLAGWVRRAGRIVHRAG